MIQTSRAPLSRASVGAMNDRKKPDDGRKPDSLHTIIGVEDGFRRRRRR